MFSWESRIAVPERRVGGRGGGGERETERDRDRLRQREKERQRGERQTDRERRRETDRQTERDRDGGWGHREREKRESRATLLYDSLTSVEFLQTRAWPRRSELPLLTNFSFLPSPPLPPPPPPFSPHAPTCLHPSVLWVLYKTCLKPQDIVLASIQFSSL